MANNSGKPAAAKTALILALNPSIDAEWRVTDVLWEEKNDVRSERRWAGGKGINVARWLQHLGGRARLLVPLGGGSGRELAEYLRADKVTHQTVALRSPTRVNVIVTTDTGAQMRFNPAGPRVSATEANQIFAAVKRLLAQSNLLVLSGSLPPGLPKDTYARLIRLAHQQGVRTLLDCDGPAFAAAVSARPFLVKPNEHELAQWWGRPLRSEAELVRVARTLSRRTGGWVLVSRGAKRGILLNEPEESQFFEMPPRVKPRNTVGAGDALLAAVACQLQHAAPPSRWLPHGLRAGSAATQYPAGQFK